MTHILIVEDEPRIVTFLEKGLQSNGFVTTTVLDGAAAVPMALEGIFDLMILDLGLPKKDGLKVLEEIRGQGAQLPVLILTARDDIQDKVSGFESGADDYLTKPFRFEELLVRVRARLRPIMAAAAQSADLTLRQGDITLDLRTHKVKVAERPVELSAREFTMLEVFLRHPGQVVSREQLLNSVWGYDYDPGSNVVDVYVGYLRKKIGGDAIETVRGMGYRWKA
ncbi:MAG: response regulator transcription factor [Pegethrix bostrychoides GSE-TBD4-15B]|jgi:DNA-binding response OmpR family regulator|uniref:Response regulator transcription factor n=1 Tax=Pegethrix bostrychoides GSE-TBD4-15B TaxID=2839662 RepID=A0A951P754_9CYAN|nr:response regulator transcription factor [Pegethrix bostrychoides GSE-TBD4-15B]